MAKDKKLNIKVGVKGAKEAKKKLKSVDSGLSSMGKKALAAGGAFFAAQGIISGFRSVIDAAGRQEMAQKKLEQALGGTSKALLEQAAALQQVSIFGDEAIIEQQGFLASLKFTEDQIKTIIPVAMDLASATGMSLESAVRNTAKTFSGMAGELGELVPQIRTLTKEQMMAGDAVKIMGDLFAGQALAQADTMTGSIEQMSNAIGDTAESIGSVIAPAVISLAKGFKGVAEGISAVVSASKELAPLNEAQQKIHDEMNKPLREQLQLRRDELTAVIGARSEHDSFTDAIKGRSLAERLLAIDIMQQIKTLKGKITAEEEAMLQTEQTELKLRTVSSAMIETDQVYLNFLETQKKKSEELKIEADLMERLKLEYPELALQLGFIREEQETTTTALQEWGFVYESVTNRVVNLSNKQKQSIEQQQPQHSVQDMLMLKR